MYKIILSTILCFLSVVCLNADDAELPLITVFGTATTEITPDLMIWITNIKNKGADLEVVAEEHAKIVKSVLKNLERTGSIKVGRE
jgi:uncharacterized protein YggE